MSIKSKLVSRAGSLVAALAVVLGALVPVLSPFASAAGQVQVRSIQMSDATAGQTGVTYKVTFTPATTAAQSLVIDFCSNGSIIGSACTAPTGLDVSTAGFTAGTGTASWDLGTNTASQVYLNKDTGANLGTSAIDFELTGITNPSAPVASFWARVYTYNDDTYGSTTTPYVDADTLGDYEDYGGFAMSTTTLINITATVMETLTFCTSKSAPGAGCTGTDAPNLILGHGTPAVIDSSTNDVDTAHFQISTNAVAGAIINMKSHNTCSGLSRDGGTTCPIPGIGTITTFTAATEDFGMHVTTVAGGTGTVNPTTDYDGSTATNWGMTAGVTSTYGATIANTAGAPTANVNRMMTFSAQAGVTTPAGVYSVNESLIATGTY